MERRGLGKVIWFVRRFGMRELFGKAIREVFAPRRSHATFNFCGKTHRYFDHPYNWTWLNERCVEIPIALSEIKGVDPASVLEVGNVLSHYTEIKHRVIDKYEGPEKMDITDLTDSAVYDRIISISTFEHIGFDEDDVKLCKIHEGVESCIRALKPGGTLLFTVPINYNPEADRVAREMQSNYLFRFSISEWVHTPELECRYGKPYPYANQIAVCRITRR